MIAIRNYFPLIYILFYQNILHKQKNKKDIISLHSIFENQSQYVITHYFILYLDI